MIHLRNPVLARRVAEHEMVLLGYIIDREVMIIMTSDDYMVWQVSAISARYLHNVVLHFTVSYTPPQNSGQDFAHSQVKNVTMRRLY
jgi:hypothetical protein